MDWIDNIVQGLLDLYNTDDPFELCDYLNIKLIKTDTKILRGQNSMYFRCLGGRECILYATGLRYRRLKYYILHELGHALLHPNLACSAHTNNGKLERQANYFAIKMLFHDGFEGVDGLTVENAALENDIPVKVMEGVI